ncbi:hypothetical protein A2852_02645 [Candidatus Adlerbacteria bacterium RIFCSPHIGHO2_01_FULL_54_23]|nr:MAG: hypothetical protein A2852_02645 [Candidatus Adlerbacteria bacterium RIFCSPHIGHO2_01_FULL_54_23]
MKFLFKKERVFFFRGCRRAREAVAGRFVERTIQVKATTHSARAHWLQLLIFDKVGSSGIIKTLQNQTQRLFKGRNARGASRRAPLRRRNPSCFET